MRGVYLQHLDRQWCGGSHHVGFAQDIAARVRKHWAGDGADYTRSAVRRGIALHLVRVWPSAGKDVEVRIEREGGGVAYCRWCQTKPWSP